MLLLMNAEVSSKFYDFCLSWSGAETKSKRMGEELKVLVGITAHITGKQRESLDTG